MVLHILFLFVHLTVLVMILLTVFCFSHLKSMEGSPWEANTVDHQYNADSGGSFGIMLYVKLTLPNFGIHHVMYIYAMTRIPEI